MSSARRKWQLSMRSMFLLVAFLSAVCAVGFYLRQELQPIIVINADVPGTHVFIRETDLGPVPVVLTENSVRALVGETAVFPRAGYDEIMSSGNGGLGVYSRNPSRTNWEVFFQVPGNDNYFRIDTPYGKFRTLFGYRGRRFGWFNNRIAFDCNVTGPDVEHRMPVIEVKEVVKGHPVDNKLVHFRLDGDVPPAIKRTPGGFRHLKAEVSFSGRGIDRKQPIPFDATVDQSGRITIHFEGSVTRPKQDVDWFMSCNVTEAETRETIALSNRVIVRGTDSAVRKNGRNAPMKKSLESNRRESQMTALRLLAVGMLASVFVFVGCAENAVPESDYARLLIGKWEVTNGDPELDVGSVMEFQEAGKMTIAGTSMGKEERASAVYKVEGNKIQFTLQNGDEVEKKEPLTIKKMTRQSMVLTTKWDKGVEFEFKRKK